MRPFPSRRSPALFVVVGLAAAACAPANDGSSGDEHDVVGGSGGVESPVVYLFESGDAAASPKCAGALLGEKIAITARACARTGMVVGRAEDKDGKGKRAKVTSVIVPDGDDADIALVAIDAGIGGTPAVLTHAPLQDGYSINGVASVDGRGVIGSVFGPDKGEAASVKGRMISETDTHGSILPEKGSQVCAEDLGAPVCSPPGSILKKLDPRRTCGLAGVIVGVPEADADAAPAGCSGGAWKVAALGRHVDFLKKHAPKAFEPVVVDTLLLRRFPHAPEGLWGYKTAGDVKACRIETSALEPALPGAAAKVTAKVSFAGMGERAEAYARVGIAPKSAPAKMRWLPAKALTTAKGTAFETSFEGVVSSDADGEYVVAFRASANGGESWTTCDTDGAENGFSVDKALTLVVGASDAGGSTGGVTPGGTTTAPDKTPASPKAAEESSITDPVAPASSERSGAADEDEDGEETGGDEEAEEDAPVAKKKKASSDGCAASPLGRSASAAPLAGIALALGALARRRRANDGDRDRDR